MKIGGLQKTSFIDYPQKISAIIFTQGCNMFCPYCHNPQLVYKKFFGDLIDEKTVFDFLKKRKGLLQGVVITGGEPTIQEDLKDFIRVIKQMGYLVKLDTNGSFPEKLRELIDNNFLDFIAMDIKSPLEKYNNFFNGDLNKIKQSINIIKQSNVKHLFRTTYDHRILNPLDIKKIRSAITGSDFVVQKCNI